MKIMTGYLSPSSGEVRVNGITVTPDNTSIRQGIGYLPENNPLYTDLYVREYLEIIAGFYRIDNKKKKVDEMVLLTGLGDEQHKKIGALSKGFRQRVGLAQALIHNPQVLILDEPTTGLDPNQLEDIRHLIKEISCEKTVILSSHIMQEVEAVCDRIVVINRGEIVADGPIAQLKSGRLSGKQEVTVEFREKCDPGKLKTIQGVDSIVPEGETIMTVIAEGEDIRPEIFRFAVKENLTLLTMLEKQKNLESLFHELTGNS